MPLIQVFTSTTPTPAAQDALLRELSGALAEHFDKPERWVMTCLVPGLAMTFGGTSEPTCFVAVKNIGKMSSSKTAALSADLATHLTGSLGVPQDRIYIEFTDAVGYLWGYDGGTFG